MITSSRTLASTFAEPIVAASPIAMALSRIVELKFFGIASSNFASPFASAFAISIFINFFCFLFSTGLKFRLAFAITPSPPKLSSLAVV